MSALTPYTFMINGQAVPSPNLGSNLFQSEWISFNFNDIFANFWSATIAQKKKFFWVYNYILASDWQTIWSTLIQPVLSNQVSGATYSPPSAYAFSGNSFHITSWVPGVEGSVQGAVGGGWMTELCYLGTPTTPVPLLAQAGSPVALSAELDWIQIPGKLYMGSVDLPLTVSAVTSTLTITANFGSYTLDQSQSDYAVMVNGVVQVIETFAFDTATATVTITIGSLAVGNTVFLVCRNGGSTYTGICASS